MKQFIVTSNGSKSGSPEYFVVGVFSTPELRDAALKQCGGNARVIEVESDCLYKLKEDEYGRMVNDKYIGGSQY